jgi:CRISPR-associated protein Cas2
MWILIMFDLPVLTKEERKRAVDFRNFLLDEGFEMSQLSVYTRHTSSREKGNAIAKRILKEIPEMGKVSILFFTDKQFKEIISYYNCKKQACLEKEPEQFLLL